MIVDIWLRICRLHAGQHYKHQCENCYEYSLNPEDRHLNAVLIGFLQLAWQIACFAYRKNTLRGAGYHYADLTYNSESNQQCHHMAHPGTVQ